MTGHCPCLPLAVVAIDHMTIGPAIEGWTIDLEDLKLEFLRVRYQGVHVHGVSDTPISELMVISAMNVCTSIDDT